MTTTRTETHINAPRPRVFKALIDPKAVVNWMVPDGMTSQIHEFEAQEGGKFRISLTYDDPGSPGKTTSHTDTYHGNFVALVPDERVIQLMEFETDDPAMQGKMTVTFKLSDAGDGTTVEALHEGVPEGVKPEDNELGWRMSLGKLAKLLEGTES
jgi:uncharacterized protein YndB with AHSA1/START domain